MSEKQLMTMNGLLQMVADSNIYELEEDQIHILTEYISKKVNVKLLDEKIKETCIDLAGVAEPKWCADMDFIKADNQDRLELIWKLLSYSDSLIKRIEYIKKNKESIDGEWEVSFLNVFKDLGETIAEHVDFKSQEFEKSFLPNRIQKIFGLENKNPYLEENECQKLDK